MPNHILYSFRRCPYAIRARLGLAHCGIDTQVREVELRNKPASMLALSPKATVPVLLVDGDQQQLIEESLEIMHWAVQHSVSPFSLEELEHELVLENDTTFKQNLDRYKYFDRYPEHSQEYYWEQVKPFLVKLEQHLIDGPSGPQLLNGQASLIDWAIFPFVRQCYFAEPSNFAQLRLPRLIQWLEGHFNDPVFVQQLRKHPFWYVQGDSTFRLLVENT